MNNYRTRQGAARRQPQAIAISQQAPYQKVAFPIFASAFAALILGLILRGLS